MMAPPLSLYRSGSSYRPAFLLLVLGLVGVLGAGGCKVQDASESAPPPPVGVVDSVFPIEEELRRFREGMTATDTLFGGESSPEALLDALVRALEAADTLGIARLGMTPTEFAYLYYPYTRYTSPPYELSPGLVWFQLQNRSSRGLNRLIQRYEGETLLRPTLSCPDEGEALGSGWIWDGCTVVGTLPSGESVEERLFGSVLRVGNRHKFVSFANEF